MAEEQQATKIKALLQQKIASAIANKKKEVLYAGVQEVLKKPREDR